MSLLFFRPVPTPEFIGRFGMPLFGSNGSIECSKMHLREMADLGACIREPILDLVLLSLIRLDHSKLARDSARALKDDRDLADPFVSFWQCFYQGFAHLVQKRASVVAAENG